MKNIDPLIYIILVNYNNYEDTLECVKSLKNCTYKNYNIIVVDNASNNASINELRKYKNEYILIEAKENLGFSAGNNVGIKFAINHGADYILLINNDTVVDKGFLEPLISVVESDSEIGIMSGQIYYYDYSNLLWFDGGYINSWKGQAYHKNIKKENDSSLPILEEVDFLTGCFMFMPVKVIESVGGLDEDYFLYYEDTDFCSKVRKHGYKLILNRSSKIYHKISKSTSENSDLYLYYNTRNRLIFVQRNIDNVNEYISYMYILISIIYKWIKYRNVFLFKGLKDFLQGKRGKVDLRK